MILENQWKELRKLSNERSENSISFLSFRKTFNFLPQNLKLKRKTNQKSPPKLSEINRTCFKSEMDQMELDVQQQIPRHNSSIDKSNSASFQILLPLKMLFSSSINILMSQTVLPITDPTTANSQIMRNIKLTKFKNLT